MLPKHFPAIGIDFAEGDCSHSGSFKSKAESADPGEEVEDIHPAERCVSFVSVR